MGEKDRVRKREFLVHLLDEEFEVLSQKAQEAKMKKSEYIRNVILFGAANRQRTHSTEDAIKICYELNRIGNNINCLRSRKLTEQVS